MPTARHHRSVAGPRPGARHRPGRRGLDARAGRPHRRRRSTRAAARPGPDVLADPGRRDRPRAPVRDRRRRRRPARPARAQRLRARPVAAAAAGRARHRRRCAPCWRPTWSRRTRCSGCCCRRCGRRRPGARRSPATRPRRRTRAGAGTAPARPRSTSSPRCSAPRSRTCGSTRSTRATCAPPCTPDAFPGEDISDRPEPETVVPALRRLIDGDLPSGRYAAATCSHRTARAGRRPRGAGAGAGMTAAARAGVRGRLRRRAHRDRAAGGARAGARRRPDARRLGERRAAARPWSASCRRCCAPATSSSSTPPTRCRPRCAG